MTLDVYGISKYTFTNAEVQRQKNGQVQLALVLRSSLAQVTQKITW